MRGGTVGIGTAEDTGLESLATASIGQLKELLNLLAQLDLQLSTLSGHAIDQFNVNYAALQEKVQQTDRLLTEKLTDADLSGPLRRLLDKREQLQREALQRLRETLPGARNAKSLLVSEMQALKRGKQALGGYRNPVVRHGTIIDRRR